MFPATAIFKTLVRRTRFLAGAIAFLGVVGPMANAADEKPLPATQPTTQPAGIVKDGLDASGAIALMVNKSIVVNTVRPIIRVNPSQPEIADVRPLGPNSMLVMAHKPGSAQVIVWDDTDKSQVIDINVYVDLASLNELYRKLFPNSRVEASSIEGQIVLRGRIGSADMASQAAQAAAPYGKVLNLLEVAGGQQVMLKVRFAEVSRSAISALGINGAVVDGSFIGGSNIGQINPLSAFAPGTVGRIPANAGSSLDTQAINSSVTLFGAGQIGSTYLQGFLTALRENNLLRILAEPNLVTMSGKEASFLAGGEFPIPVSQAGGGSGTAITIEFREFGVKLAFLPVVLGDGRIRLQVNPEVSDLDFTTAVKFNGFVVPGLTQRKVSTTVELAEGQTFAVAGLLNNSVSASKDVTPLLGDIPVLGALFRSVRYQRKETELVVLVTPVLVEPMNPGQTPTVPGERWRHPTENELFFKQDLGGPEPDLARSPAADAKAAKEDKADAPRFYGAYGFSPATQPTAAAH